MSPKSLALIAAAVAVTGMGLYLFVQVKATPAQAHVPSPTTATARPSHAPERSPEAPPAATEPTPSVPAPAPTRPVRVANDVAAPQPAIAGAEDEQRANPRQDSMMELANKAYDAQEFDQAALIAQKVLAKDPTNVRMLRIMVSANCIGGDSGVAQQYYEKLPAFDRGQMKTRCERYGVFFTDPAQ